MPNVKDEEYLLPEIYTETLRYTEVHYVLAGEAAMADLEDFQVSTFRVLAALDCFLVPRKRNAKVRLRNSYRYTGGLFMFANAVFHYESQHGLEDLDPSVITKAAKWWGASLRKVKMTDDLREFAQLVKDRCARSELEDMDVDLLATLALKRWLALDFAVEPLAPSQNYDVSARVKTMDPRSLEFEALMLTMPELQCNPQTFRWTFRPEYHPGARR